MAVPGAGDRRLRDEDRGTAADEGHAFGAVDYGVEAEQIGVIVGRVLLHLPPPQQHADDAPPEGESGARLEIARADAVRPAFSRLCGKDWSSLEAIKGRITDRVDFGLQPAHSAVVRCLGLRHAVPFSKDQPQRHLAQQSQVPA
ncbi:hypothetical protein L485_22370 [Sphingobium baderi LL03]|uniref:Uncharacterized protein n=1 Tax=Sphingobium baderi LL03 TaxID=1114964 RepID=T0FZP4_9SPHN|nr:hypothetical protein L485_22370 [Sphingobium baderi LL03]